jgi:hypothetical protein
MDPFGDRKDGRVGLAAVDVALGFQRRFRPVGTDLHQIVNGREIILTRVARIRPFPLDRGPSASGGWP